MREFRREVWNGIHQTVVDQHGSAVAFDVDGEDNANLFAAAPGLLAACEYALDAMSGPDGPEPTTAEKMATDGLRAAIARARGEA